MFSSLTYPVSYSCFSAFVFQNFSLRSFYSFNFSSFLFISLLHPLSQHPLFSAFLYLCTAPLSAPSHHVNYTTVLFLYYSPLCYFCHPHCCACICYIANILLGSAVAVEMRRGRVLVPNSTTNGCLASSDWHRLVGCWRWCGGGSCRRPGSFIAAVCALQTDLFAWFL